MTSILAVALLLCCISAKDIDDHGIHLGCGIVAMLCLCKRHSMSCYIIMLHHAGVPQECTEAAAEDKSEPD